MLLKRHIPLLIVIVVGLITLFGHFIAHEGINNFVKNVSTEWFDIIASFAIFLGALNMMKLHAKKIINKAIRMSTHMKHREKTDNKMFQFSW